MPMSPRRGTRSPLLIPELFYIVLQFLVEPSTSEMSPFEGGIPFRTPSQDGRRAFAALARTCRSFKQPSLNLLWRQLDSLEPLLWCYSSREAVSAGRRPLRPPSPADWAVIRRYAHRVQQVQVQNDNSTFFLGCAMFESNLFPNLKALKWNTQPHLNPIGITLIQPLLGPGIVALDVCGSEYDIALLSFLQACPLRCPAVTTARFNISVQRQWELMDVFSRTLCTFKNLRSLIVDHCVTDGALHHLLMSPHLEELDIFIHTNQLHEFSSPPSVVPLRNTKKLGLRLADLQLLPQILRPGDQTFREIALQLVHLEFGPSIGAIFTGLASHLEISPLQSLHVRSTQSHAHVRDSTSSFLLSFDTFQPLACHANLRELVIKLENPISLSDEELANLVQSWPLLQVFELCHVRLLQRGAKHLTLNGLLSLVPVCPDLRHVGLTLDGRDVPSGAPAGLVSKTITTLRFRNSPVDNQARLVAKFLLAHFPSVTSVSDNRAQMGPFTVDRHAGEWIDVEEYIIHPSRLESTELSEVGDCGDGCLDARP